MNCDQMFGTNKAEYILCAAILIPTKTRNLHTPKNCKETDLVVCGRRHHNCFAIIKQLGVDFKKIKEDKIVQGFMTSHDNFLNRKEAIKLAVQTGQIEKEKTQLFSEDLY